MLLWFFFKKVALAFQVTHLDIRTVDAIVKKQVVGMIRGAYYRCLTYEYQQLPPVLRKKRIIFRDKCSWPENKDQNTLIATISIYVTWQAFMGR